MTITITTTTIAAFGNHSGDGTFFNPGLGACGTTANDNTMVVALAAPDFDPHTPPSGNSNQNSLCGKRVRIFRNGKSVDATIQDRCPPPCKVGDIDMSPVWIFTLTGLE
ncbi:12209_t:CDS:2 [Ambispora gerdemannii]|uniref:12209_t:CDS:1 n=1 Tax=Ambispora gerdemannii TaxID=144530 RepID=A0A9N8ZRP5_9GLOM|nr:12209_t:CDS:2 [Ambispora gerdemannii]